MKSKAKGFLFIALAVVVLMGCSGSREQIGIRYFPVKVEVTSVGISKARNDGTGSLSSLPVTCRVRNEVGRDLYVDEHTISGLIWHGEWSDGDGRRWIFTSRESFVSFRPTEPLRLRALAETNLTVYVYTGTPPIIPLNDHPIFQKLGTNAEPRSLHYRLLADEDDAKYPRTRHILFRGYGSASVD